MSMKDRVVEMKEEIEELRKQSQENTLATEMLRELKATSKRKDIIIIILITVIITMFIIDCIKDSQYETVTTETEQVIEDVDNSQNSTYTQNMD